MEGVQTSLLPMTPDRSVMWATADIPSLQGALYSSPNCPDRVIGRLLAMAHPDSTVFANLRLVSAKGRLGIVAEDEGVAYKKMKGQYPEPETGLSALRANLTLGAGFMAIRDSVEPPPMPKWQTAVQYDTPKYYAAFMPHPDSNVPNVWAMSYEVGEHPYDQLYDPLPPFDERIDYYGKAVADLGLPPQYVCFDEVPENMLVEYPTVAHPDITRIVKLDVMAAQDYGPDFSLLA